MSDTELRDLLDACHANIRRTLGGLAALATDDGLRDPRAPATASACARYLREGLPLHAQDEDQSIAPRLRALPGIPDATLDTLDALEDEHDDIEEEVRQLLPVLERIAAGLQVPLHPERLDGLLRAHIAREEAEWFGLLARLSADARSDIVRELRRRRGAP